MISTRLPLALLAAAAFLPVPVEARHPDPRRDLAEAAAQLSEAAHSLHLRAERMAHHGDWREERALRVLHRLDEEARTFHRGLLHARSRGWDEPRTRDRRADRHAPEDRWDRHESRFDRPSRRDLEELLRVWDATLWAWDDLHAFRPLDRDFRQVAHEVRSVERAWDRLAHGTDRWPPRDRWDDGRDRHEPVVIELPRIPLPPFLR